jgi:hypothetical protein
VIYKIQSDCILIGEESEGPQQLQCSGSDTHVAGVAAPANTSEVRRKDIQWWTIVHRIDDSGKFKGWRCHSESWLKPSGLRKMSKQEHYAEICRALIALATQVKDENGSSSSEPGYRLDINLKTEENSCSLCLRRKFQRCWSKFASTDLKEIDASEVYVLCGKLAFCANELFVKKLETEAENRARLEDMQELKRAMEILQESRHQMEQQLYQRMAALLNEKKRIIKEMRADTNDGGSSGSEVDS